MTAVGYDKDRSFLLVEISGEELFFQTVSRTSFTFDSGAIHRPAKLQPATTPPSGSRPQGTSRLVGPYRAFGLGPENAFSLGRIADQPPGVGSLLSTGRVAMYLHYKIPVLE